MQEENKVKKSFHQNMKAELKKVIWPTGKQVVKSTFATIGFVLLIAVTLMILNFVFDFLNNKWFNFVTGNNNNIVVGTSGDVSGDDSLNVTDEVISGDYEIVSGEEAIVE